METTSVGLLLSHGDIDKWLQMFIVEYFCSKKILLVSLLKLRWNLTVLSVNSKSFIKEKKLVVLFCFSFFFCKNQLVPCSTLSLRKIFQGFHFHRIFFFFGNKKLKRKNLGQKSSMFSFCFLSPFHKWKGETRLVKIKFIIITLPLFIWTHWVKHCSETRENSFYEFLLLFPSSSLYYDKYDFGFKLCAMQYWE